MTAVSPFDETYGLEITLCDEEVVEAVVPVVPQTAQVTGLVHGGVLAAMAESMASLGTNTAVRSTGQIALGASNHTSFLRPISRGSIWGRARRLHRGRTTWVWDVEFRDDGGRLCAVSRMTIAVRAADSSVPRKAND